MTQTHDDLIQASAIGDEATVQKWLSRNGARPLPDADALIRAAENGHETIVRLLLPVSDPQAKSSQALARAAQRGHEAIVRRLLPVSDPKAKNSLALTYAVQNGHEAIVRLLLPVSDPKADHSWALTQAALYGHEAIVRLLLPLSDPKADDSRALVYSALNGHEAIVAILVESSEAFKAWRSLIQGEAWKGLDLLAPYMPEDTVEAVLKQAPAEALPRARALRLNQTLAKTLAGAPARSLKNRL